MTKTVGGFLILLAATEDGLDIDADITEKYNITSPKPYRVTVRMMMAQVLGGNHRPGEMWEYDELGTMWLHLLPTVILAATGHKASYYMDRLHTRLGLSPQFTWPEVDTKWFRGAAGSCRDWARFGQLILNGGEWDGEQLIASTWITEMQQPVKNHPYNTYSNPCYGLLVWLNANKSKHPGCCWEASRLPEPKCNDETFMDGGVHDLTLNIGLYGQIVMTLPSANTVVVGFGSDLRPIEPALIGYYPGVCKALGIPCNRPPPVPPTRCGEMMECTGVSAQCFSGGSWSHDEPEPGKQRCVECFQNRLPYYETLFPEAKFMVSNWCPKNAVDAMKFIACFCGLTGRNANPWAPWPTTTTTTPPLSPSPPLPPPPPTPSPPAPGPLCGLTARCIQGLEARWKCYDMPRNGGHNCYRGIDVHQATLKIRYGCPDFTNKKTPVIQSKAFCWCGYDPHPKLDRSFTPRLLINAPRLGEMGGRGHPNFCRKKDSRWIRHLSKSTVEKMIYDCAESQYGPDGKDATTCMRWKFTMLWHWKLRTINYGCASCFGYLIHCGHTYCPEHCACGADNGCRDCVKSNCEREFDRCSGRKGPHSLSTNNTIHNLVGDDGALLEEQPLITV